MFPKHKRLNLKKNFKWVASGEKIESKNFKIFAKEGENKEPLVGIAVSGSIFKKSTQRNRAKRISFSAIEPSYKDLRKDLNLVIMPKIGVLEAKVNDLKEELKQIHFLYE